MKLTARQLRKMIKEELIREGVLDRLKGSLGVGRLPALSSGRAVAALGMGDNDEGPSVEEYKQQFLDKINSLRSHFADSPKNFLAEVGEETLRTPLVDELTLAQIAEAVDEVIKFDAEAIRGLQRLSADLKKDAQ